MRHQAKGGGSGSGSNISTRIAASALTAGQGIAKGLREPCYPYREAYFFGAPFGSAPDASGWNCVPKLVDSTIFYDLSGMEPNHEVVVCLTIFYNVPAGKAPIVRHKWVQRLDSTTETVFSIDYMIPDPGDYGHEYWEWYYVYSYIGYVDVDEYGYVEICRNGDYNVSATMDGEDVGNWGFSVEGIEPPPEEYTLDVIIEPEVAGYVTKEPDLPEYPGGTQVNLYAYTNEGYEFQRWVWDSVEGGTGDSIGIIVNFDITVRAIFEEITPPPPEFEGSINAVELEYDSSRVPVPVSAVPLGSDVRFGVYAENLLDSPQRMGVRIVAFSPYTGSPPPPTWRYEGWKTVNPGVESLWVTDRFTVDEVGDWKVVVSLVMNESEPVEVDRYDGVMCTVTEEAEYKGRIESDAIEMKWNEGQEFIPVDNIVVGTEAQVRVLCTNLMSTREQMGVTVEINGPTQSYSWTDWTTLGVPAGEAEDWWFPGLYTKFTINEMGSWIIRIKLEMGEQANPIVADEFEGILCTVTEKTKYLGEITSMRLGHEGVLDDIPVSVLIPAGADGQMHVWARNNMTISQKLGIHWIVKDSEGSIVQDYEDWTFFTVAPGQEHDHFVAGTFDLDKAGEYTVLIEMLMGEEGVDEVIVDSYEGPLCTTIPEEPTPPPEARFPWGWVLIGAGVFAGAFALTRKRRKKGSEAIEKSR